MHMEHETNCLFLFAEDLTYEASSFNADADAYPDADARSSIADDDPNEWCESSRKPLLFRGGFFRFLKRDGVTVRAECSNCKSGNVYSGHTRSNSNLLKHLSVSCSSMFLITLILSFLINVFCYLANASEDL